MHPEYLVNGKYRQVIRQKINEGMAFPETIRIMKAELFLFNDKPRKTLWKDGTGKFRQNVTPTPRIRIWDQDGIMGEGNASPELWNNFIPFMLGFKKPMTNLEWRKYLYWHERGADAYSRAMLEAEMLFFDIIAKKRGIPVHRLLGGKDQCDAYKGGGSTVETDDELVEEMLMNKAEGFRTTKIKVGLNDFDEDFRRLNKVRKALGPDFNIAVDANQAWDAETCMAFLRREKQEDIGLHFFEEPIVHTDTEEIVKLVRMMHEEDLYVPLAYGENARNINTFKSYIDAGVEIIQPSMFCSYTIAEALRIADFARSHGKRITSAQNHLGCVFGTLLQDGEMVEFHRPWIEGNEEYYADCPKMGFDGKIHMPEFPGAPIRMDWEKLMNEGMLKRIEYLYEQRFPDCGA